MLLCATAYTAARRPRWLPLALGLFLASKQYNFLALPFIGYLVQPFSWKAYWKLLVLSLGIALATFLPFAIWNFRALWHDLVCFIISSRFVRMHLALPSPFRCTRRSARFCCLRLWYGRRGAEPSRQQRLRQLTEWR